MNEADSLQRDLRLKSLGMKVLILGNFKGSGLLFVQSNWTTLVVTALDNLLIYSLDNVMISYSKRYNSEL